MRIVYSVIFGLIAFFASVSAVSHHSFSAEFDVSRPVELTGKVTSVEWTNPHAWVFMDAEDEEGNLQHWAIEMLGVYALMRSGMTPDTVKEGTLLTVKGFGSRDGTNTANASMVINAETGQQLWSSAREGKE